MRKQWTAENACERSLYSEKKIAKNTTRRKSERLKVLMKAASASAGRAAARCLCCLRCLCDWMCDWIFVLGIQTSLSLLLAALRTARGGLTLFFLFSLRSLTASKVHRVHGPFPLPLIELVRFDVVASFTVLDV